MQQMRNHIAVFIGAAFIAAFVVGAGANRPSTSGRFARILQRRGAFEDAARYRCNGLHM